MVNAGLEDGYLANPPLARVHWQAGYRELPAASVPEQSGTRASAASRPGTFPAPSLIIVVTAVIEACDIGPAAFRSA